MIKLACEAASTGPELSASLKNAPRILTVRRSLLAKISFTPESLWVVPLTLEHKVRHSPGLSKMEFPRDLAKSGLSHPIERDTVNFLVLRGPTRLSMTMPPASRVPPPPEGHQVVGVRKRRTG